jgi:hypothetical protein
MSRSIDADARQSAPQPQGRMPLAQGRAGTGQSAESARETPPPARSTDRDLRALRLNRELSKLSDSERHVMADVGRFRTLAAEDLRQIRYGGDSQALRKDVTRLKAEGLVSEHRILVKAGDRPMTVLALTNKGRDLAMRDGPPEQVFYAGLKKPREVMHDAAIYRMSQAEAARIEAAGGRVTRVVLDYEFKRKLYSEVAKADPEIQAELRMRLAQQNDLKVIEGKVLLPDLRIEYEGPSGERAKVDLELATEHYHAGQLADKARAGFKVYAPAESAGRLRSAWDDHNLMGEIFSL